MSTTNFLSRIKNSTKHQKYHIFVGFFVTSLIYILGSGIIFSMICGFSIGLIVELLYCYSPVKNYKILGISINIVDYNGLKKSIQNMNIVTRHEFDDGNMFYNSVGVILSIVLKIILFISEIRF